VPLGRVLLPLAGYCAHNPNAPGNLGGNGAGIGRCNAALCITSPRLPLHNNIAAAVAVAVAVAFMGLAVAVAVAVAFMAFDLMVLAVAVAVMGFNLATTTTPFNAAAAFGAGWAAVRAGGKNEGHASPARIPQPSNCQTLSACFKFAFFHCF